MQRHTETVSNIATKVRAFYDGKIPFRISHGSTNSTRLNLTKRQNVIDTSSLCNVLRIDRERKTALVEPNVPMDKLVAATLPHGLVPPVVMEFPGITAGGGYAGTAGESSSFKHGFFDRTINYVEMVLGNGEIVRASPTEREDLFNGAAGAVGTLGVTTLLELQLVDAKNYVQATYHPVKNTDDALAKIKSLCSDPELDYVDGIMFSKTQGAVISGKLTNEIPSGGQLQRFSRPKDPWFYLHVSDATERQASKGMTTPVVETIPIAEYLFRYDRGGFWVGRSAFDYWKFPFGWFTRWFLDDFLHTRMLYRALHASRQSMRYVVQDMALPYETASDFVKYTHDNFNIYPLWLCPLKQSPRPTFHPHMLENNNTEMNQMINIGLWGFGPKDRKKFLAKNIELEKTLRKFGGMKWFYAQTYYTEEDFWEMYDKPWYQALREKYSATHLPTVYDKIKWDSEKERIELQTSWKLWLLKIWPVAGVWGVWKSMLSGDWKIPKAVNVSRMQVGFPNDKMP
jgi:delta24-sterol reductase